MYVVNQSRLPFVGMSHEFVGSDHGGVGISFFLVVGDRGRGTRLRKHNYDEVVYVMEGRSKWTVGDQVREASAGDVVIVRAGEPTQIHKQWRRPLRQFDIHLNPTFETIWLEEELSLQITRKFDRKQRRIHPLLDRQCQEAGSAGLRVFIGQGGWKLPGVESR
jgi:mannose-6-phosphate isomerase-like protein (cupin superfamily)